MEERKDLNGRKKRLYDLYNFQQYENCINHRSALGKLTCKISEGSLQWLENFDYIFFKASDQCCVQLAPKVTEITCKADLTGEDVWACESDVYPLEEKM